MAKGNNKKDEGVIAPGIRRRGKSIQLDFYFERVRNRETLALDPSIRGNIEFAKKKLAAIKYEIAIGKFNYLDHFPNSTRASVYGHSAVTDMTISSLVDWYIEQRKAEWGDETVSSYKTYSNCHIKPGIGRILVKNLKPSQVKHWLSNTPGTNKQKNNWLIVLRGAYRAAKQDGMIEHNPMADFTNLKLEQREPDPFDVEQIEAILSSFEQPEARYFYDVGFWSGLSPSERRGLQWDDIDFLNNIIHIRRAYVRRKINPTKNTHRWRTIDMLPPVREALLRLREINPDSEWVFIDPDTGKVWNEQTVRQRWIKALQAAGVKHKRGYTTRHTYASLLLSVGIPLSWLKAQMGHSNYRMLEQVYARWTNISTAQRKKMLNWFLEMSKGGHIPEALAPFVQQIQ